MAITFSCGNCGKPYRIDERFAGKKVACRACGKINVVPGDTIAVAPPIPEAPTAREGVIAYPPEKDTIAIDDVGIRVLDDPEDPNGRTDELELAPPDQTDTLHEVRVIPREPAGPPIASVPVARSLGEQAVAAGECPNCGTPTAKGAIICTGCGLNFKTGRQAVTAIPVEEEDDHDDAAEPRESRDWMHVFAGGGIFGRQAMGFVIAGVLVALLALVTAPGLAMLGTVLAMIGAILYFVDGSKPQSAAAGGATVLALVLFFVARPGEPPPPPPPPVVIAPPPPPPATLPTQPAPEPVPETAVVTKVSPGVFRHNNPAKNQNPVDFWRPLRNDGDPEVRLFLVQQLSRIPDPHQTQARDLIAELVTDGDPRVRRAALVHTTQVKTEKAVEVAKNAMNDGDRDVALIAIRAAARFKDDALIDPLVSKYDQFGDEVVDALQQFTAPESAAKVNQAFERLLGMGDPASRVRLIGILVARDPEGAVKLLMPLIADHNPEIRAEAMGRLADMKNAAALTAMLDRLDADPENVKKALKKYGPLAEAPVLSQLLATQDAPRKVLLLNLLKEIGTTQALRPVKLLAEDKELPVAIAARETWRKLAPGEFTELDEAILDLSSPGREFVERALEMLAKMRPDAPETDPALRTAYERQRGRVVRNVYEIVAKNDGDLAPKAIPALMAWANKQFKDALYATIRPDPKVPNPFMDPARRVTAMRLAGATKEPTALVPIVICLEHNTEPSVAAEALKLYGSMAEEEVIRLLFRAKPEVQQTCCDILKEIGTPRAQPALIRMVWLAKELSMKDQARETLLHIQMRVATERDRAANMEKLGK